MDLCLLSNYACIYCYCHFIFQDNFEIQTQPVSPAFVLAVGTTLTMSPCGVATRFSVVRSDAPAG